MINFEYNIDSKYRVVMVVFWYKCIIVSVLDGMVGNFYILFFYLFNCYGIYEFKLSVVKLF